MSTPPPRQCRRICSSYSRLNRELNGICHNIRPEPTDLPRASADSLDPTLSIRDFIILGESPIYPYHLVTLRKSCLSELAYWAHEPQNSTLTYAHGEVYSLPWNDTYSSAAKVAFTAHTTTSDASPVQVLVWRHKLELRYGPQRLLLPASTGAAPNTTQVCFADVTSRVDSTIKILHGSTLYLYEPRGGSPLQNPLPTSKLWSQPSISTTFQSDSSNLKEYELLPRIRSASLIALATAFLSASPRLRILLGTNTPLFDPAPQSTFLSARRPMRTKPGVFGPHARTIIALGGLEKWTKMFHLFLFMLELPCPDIYPKISVVVAKSFAVAQVEWDAEYMFELALEKVGVGEYVRARAMGRGHECETDCFAGETGEFVKVLKTYGGRNVSEIRCDNLGIVLEGWKENKDGRIWEMLMAGLEEEEDEAIREIRRIVQLDHWMAP